MKISYREINGKILIFINIRGYYSGAGRANSYIMKIPLTQRIDSGAHGGQTNASSTRTQIACDIIYTCVPNVYTIKCRSNHRPFIDFEAGFSIRELNEKQSKRNENELPNCLSQRRLLKAELFKQKPVVKCVSSLVDVHLFIYSCVHMLVCLLKRCERYVLCTCRCR